jgi:hypothetical protein
MIAPSTTYKVTDPNGIVIAAGSAKKMRALHKKIGYGKGYRIYVSPSSKVGDKIGN